MSPRSLLARLGWDEGDAWTVAIGLSLALALAVTSIPAALRAEPALRAATAPVLESPPPQAAPPGAPPAVALPPPSEIPALPPLPLPEPVPAQPPFVGPVAPGPAPQPRSTASAAAPLAVGELRGFAALASEGSPGGLATATDGTVHAATDGSGPSTLVSWDPRGRVLHQGAPPATGAPRSRGLTAVATAPDGGLLVADAATSVVRGFDRATRTWSERATIPDVAPCLLPVATGCQPGVQDTAPLLRGLAVDRDGTTYVADAGQGTVWRIAAGGTSVEPWFAAADLLGADALAGLDLDATGSVLLAVTRLSGLAADGSGVVDRVERTPDGSAGARTTVSRFAPGEDPVDVAVGSGGLYVALRGADAVVTLDADGVEQLRVTDARLTAPTALGLSDGRVLVTTGSAQPAVLQVGVADRLT